MTSIMIRYYDVTYDIFVTFQVAYLANMTNPLLCYFPLLPMIHMLPLLHFRLPTLPTWPALLAAKRLSTLPPSWASRCHSVSLFKIIAVKKPSCVTLPLSLCHKVSVTLFHKVQYFFQNLLGWKRSSSDNYFHCLHFHFIHFNFLHFNFSHFHFLHFHFSRWSHLLSFPCSDGAPPGANGHPVPITYEGFTLLTDNYNNFFMSSFIPQVKI